jgi:hypothetical protein
MVLGLKARALFWPTVTVWSGTEGELALVGATEAGADDDAAGGAPPPYWARASGRDNARRAVEGIISNRGWW